MDVQGIDTAPRLGDAPRVIPVIPVFTPVFTTPPPDIRMTRVWSGAAFLLVITTCTLWGAIDLAARLYAAVFR